MKIFKLYWILITILFFIGSFFEKGFDEMFYLGLFSFAIYSILKAIGEKNNDN